MVKLFPVKSLVSVDSPKAKPRSPSGRGDVPNRFRTNKFYDRSVFGSDDCERETGKCKCSMCSEVPIVILASGEPICDQYNITLRNVKEFLDGGLLEPLQDESFLIYLQKEPNGHCQIGLYAALDVEDCEKNIIKRHEMVTKDPETICRENDKNYQSCYVDPVMVMYQNNSTVDSIIERIMNTSKPLRVDPHKRKTVQDKTKSIDIHLKEPDSSSRSSASCSNLHLIWTVQNPNDIQQLQTAFKAVDSLYIADGHHRTAAACRYNKENSPKVVGKKLPNYINSARFLTALIFPSNQLNVLSYNRCVKSFCEGMDGNMFLNQVSKVFRLTKQSRNAVSSNRIKTLPEIDVRNVGKPPLHRSRVAAVQQERIESKLRDVGDWTSLTEDDSLATDFDESLDVPLLVLPSQRWKTEPTPIAAATATASPPPPSIPFEGVKAVDPNPTHSSSHRVDLPPEQPVDPPLVPYYQHEMAMYVQGCWYDLDPILDESYYSNPGTPKNADPNHRCSSTGSEPIDCPLSLRSPHNLNPLSVVDAQILLEKLLEPILQIRWPETENRMIYVDGREGRKGLQHRVDSGEAVVAFSVGKVSVNQIMRISDANQLLPPKATFFDPKPMPGLLLRLQR